VVGVVKGGEGIELFLFMVMVVVVVRGLTKKEY